MVVPACRVMSAALPHSYNWLPSDPRLGGLGAWERRDQLWKVQRFPMARCISGWSMLKRQTVCIADIRRDHCIPYNLYEMTFVRSLVMTPAGNPPVGALGAYWGHVYTAAPDEVAWVEALAQATGSQSSEFVSSRRKKRSY